MKASQGLFESEPLHVGFGNFYITKIAPRSGRNPRNGEVIQIKSYNQPKFKTGKKLKDACNK